MTKTLYCIALLFILLSLGGCATPYDADRSFRGLPDLSKPNPLQPDIYNHRYDKYGR
jgi:hypothetical protein